MWPKAMPTKSSAPVRCTISATASTSRVWLYTGRSSTAPEHTMIRPSAVTPNQNQIFSPALKKPLGGSPPPRKPPKRRSHCQSYARQSSPPVLINTPASMFCALVMPTRPAWASSQKGWLLPGCDCSRAASAFGSAQALAQKSASSRKSHLADAVIFVLVPGAGVDFLLPRALLAVEGRVRPGRGIARDLVCVRAVEARLARLLVLAASHEGEDDEKREKHLAHLDSLVPAAPYAVAQPLSSMLPPRGAARVRMMSASTSPSPARSALVEHISAQSGSLPSASRLRPYFLNSASLMSFSGPPAQKVHLSIL